MRVERQRVRVLDSGERLPSALGEHGEAAVRGVDVEPDAALAAEGRQLRERIDRAGVRRARGEGEERRAGPARTSASIAAASVAGIEAERSSTGSTRTWSGRKPRIRAALASDECAWSET